ncbi:MAG: hypothetical protein IAE94_08970 [Chthoniobacterales bacterium]|nr:hypothetical protein [Chthoniobacterales bacterium]
MKPLLAFLLSGSFLMAASLVEDLDPKQTEEVSGGAQVVLLEEVAGNPWPKVRIYQKVAASPDEVAAVFCDYNAAKQYVPKIIKSEVARQISPCVAEVDYGVDVPILPDEFYTARNTLMSEPDGGYVIKWHLLRAMQTKASEGNLRIEKWKDGSLIRYTNLVIPGSRMAGLLKMPAIDQMRSTVKAIVAQVEKQKSENPESLKTNVQALESALKSDPVK